MTSKYYTLQFEQRRAHAAGIFVTATAAVNSTAAPTTSVLKFAPPKHSNNCLNANTETDDNEIRGSPARQRKHGDNNGHSNSQ